MRIYVEQCSYYEVDLNLPNNATSEEIAHAISSLSLKDVEARGELCLSEYTITVSDDAEV